MEDVVKRVDLAFKAFFRRVKTGDRPGYPRAKGPGWYKTITVPRSREFKFKYETGERYGYLSFKGLSNIRLRIHRDLPQRACIRRVMVKREANGHWYAMLGWDIKDYVPPGKDDRKEDILALHLGIKNYISTDSGWIVENPKILKRHRKKVDKHQRELSRKQKGSKNREKKRVLIAKQHAKIKNARRDFQHNLSRRLVERYKIIIAENIHLKNMRSSELPSVNRAVADAALGEFLHMLRYKAESAGCVYIEVDIRDAAQECSRCGESIPKELSLPRCNCPRCGLKLARGVNAAKNIKRRAVQALRGEGGLPTSTNREALFLRSDFQRALSYN